MCPSDLLFLHQGLPAIQFNQKNPRISRKAFVAPNATLIGDVSLDERSSIWFGAVLRSELSSISIGKQSNVQDNCVIHTDDGFPVKIGDGVSVGHGCIIHGASIGSNCLIGMGAILLNGAIIGDNSLIAAGALVTQGAVMESGMLVMGSPAVAKRELSQEEIERVAQNSESYNKFRIEYLKMHW